MGKGQNDKAMPSKTPQDDTKDEQKNNMHTRNDHNRNRKTSRSSRIVKTEEGDASVSQEANPHIILAVCTHNFKITLL